MKTSDISRALCNSATPATRLAAWQSRPAVFRLRQVRDYLSKPYHKGETIAQARASLLQAYGPELSSPEADSPLLWLSGESDSEVMNSWAGREFLDHRGWFTDEDIQDETLETYAIRLHRFPHLIFYGVKDSCNGNIRVELNDWEEIDFSDCESEYGVEDATEETAKSVVRGNDSSTQKDGEESCEFYRKDRIEQDIETNRETLKTLRQSIRDLASELKSLCPSPMAGSYPAASQALRESLARMLGERSRIMGENRELAESI